MQLSNFLIPLVVVIAWAIWEYTHNRATFNIRTAGIRYGIVYAVAAFGFSYLTTFKYFQWLELAGFTAVGLLFFTVVVKVGENILKGWGWIKVLLPLVLAAGFASCSQYNTTASTPYPAQQCPMRPLDAATIDSALQGYVSIDSSHAGNPSICQTKVKLQTSWPQKWDIARHDGSIAWVYVLWPAGLLLLCFSFYSSIKKATIVRVVLTACLGIASFAGGAAAVDWATTKEVELSKAQYDAMVKDPVALKAFWDANLYK
jgi:hypothetical protein